MVAATFASVCRQLGSRVGEADALDSLGRVYRRQGQLGLAADYQQQALALYRQLGDRGAKPRCWTTSATSTALRAR